MRTDSEMKSIDGKKISSKKEYKEYLSLASVLSALAVVFLHVNSCFWEFSATERYWRTANVIECTFYFAVPVFFMISGANLLDFFNRYGLSTYFFKRIVKTVIPYIFWSIVGLVYQVWVFHAPKLADITVKYLVKGLLDGSLVRIYWYFPVLFVVYLSLPLFASVAKERRKIVYTYLVAAGFALNSLIPFILRIHGSGYAFPYSVSVVGGYLILLPLGWLLSHLDFSGWQRIFIYVCGIAGLLMHIVGTKTLSIAAGQIIDTYKGYVNVPCLLYSTGIFILIRYGGTGLLRIAPLRKVTAFLSQYTFGIYLVHILVLWTMQKVFTINHYSIVYRLTAPFLIFVVSTGCIFLIRLIPGAKRILP